MAACKTCGNKITAIRVDGNCFRCHVRSIGFTYRGGAIEGRAGWNTTQREFLAEHVGDPRSETVVKADD